MENKDKKQLDKLKEQFKGNTKGGDKKPVARIKFNLLIYAAIMSFIGIQIFEALKTSAPHQF